MASERFDYIVIGAGSAGCVLAARLTEDPNIKVLLLEAGGKNTSILVKMPAGVGELIKAKGDQNWGFWTEEEPHLDNRKLWWPRGKGLGGSSAINGMIYIRGHARDYDQWRQMGLSGWSYSEVLPYFKRSETHHAGGDAYHGGQGPLHVSGGESPSPFYPALIEAGRQAGYKTTKDFNGYQQEGFGPYDLTIRDGKRWSAAAAYLTAALSRPNLTCVTEARTTKILIEKGRAIGVDYVVGKGGEKRTAHADAEVLLSAGAVQSPQILQLSGIGAPDLLKSHGVAVVQESKGVGANLQDHLDVCLSWTTKNLMTAYSANKGLRKLGTGLSYMLMGKGMGRQQFLESGAFLKSRPDLDRPDLQIHGVLAIMQDHGKTLIEKDGFTLHVCQLRPESRGAVGLRSADPFDDPTILGNYLAADEDRRALREGVRMAREVAAQAALDPYRDAEYAPGADVRADADLDAWIRAKSETIYHPVGTCRMGAAGDAMAVVDDQLRVQGIAGLRVVDASVMPTLVGGNTNAPTIMVAERAADMIMGKAALAPMDAPVFEDGRAVAA
ncbi:choline dehydrogenase [Caulobacter sp. ErkDOM-YI]|uniref:choline dehydrogenase n=1 Tax=unclassified Caulobacter TaxID=2648921 RepID=UPI003AF6D893